MENTLPNDLMALHYEQRASGGLLITEATAISEEGSGWRNAPHITTKQHADAWKTVVDRVHDKEGIIYLQLWHMGRQAHSSHHPSTNRTISASAIAPQGMQVKTVEREYAEPEVPHALTVEEIKETVQDYVRAAMLAKEAGFDGIEVSACFLKNFPSLTFHAQYKVTSYFFTLSASHFQRSSTQPMGTSLTSSCKACPTFAPTNTAAASKIERAFS